MKNINPNLFSLTASIIGYALSEELNIYELSSIGNWLELLGQYLLTVSSQQSLVQNTSNKYNKNNKKGDTTNKIDNENNDFSNLGEHLNFLQDSLNRIIRIIGYIKG